jgi:hypothetical protein
MDVRTIKLVLMGAFKEDNKTSVSLFTFADANATSIERWDIHFQSELVLMSVK